ITRQLPISEFFPLTGDVHLVAQAVQTALLSRAPRVLLCGGEERGTWLLEQQAASDRAFAFALALGTEPEGALARLSLYAADHDDAVRPYRLAEFVDDLRTRRTVDSVAAPGLHFSLTWN